MCVCVCVCVYVCVCVCVCIQLKSPPYVSTTPEIVDMSISKKDKLVVITPQKSELNPNRHPKPETTRDKLELHLSKVRIHGRIQ